MKQFLLEKLVFPTLYVVGYCVGSIHAGYHWLVYTLGYCHGRIHALIKGTK